jgi:hypothetical protein
MRTESIRQSYADTPEAEARQIEREDREARREIRERYAPGLELKFWSSGGFPARRARVYVSRDGEDLGFVGVRRIVRELSGSYERHRWAKGEDFCQVESEGTLEKSLAASFNDMIAEYWTRLGEAHRLTDLDQFDVLWGRFLAGDEPMEKKGPRFRLIASKFRGKCAETGELICKGDPVLWDSEERKAYGARSSVFRKKASGKEGK